MSSPCQQAAQQSLESQEGELQWWVSQVKAFQKNSRDARAKWHAFCTSHGCGVRDPLRHDAAFIKNFFHLKDQGMLPDHQMLLHDMPLPSDISLAEEYRSVLEAKVQHGCRAPSYKRDFQQKFRGAQLRSICAESLLRFVQAHEVARGKDPFAAPAKFRSPLAELVKRMQSSRLCWKIQWDSYVEAAGHGVRDPSRHPAEFLDVFLTTAKPRCPKEWRTAALHPGNSGDLDYSAMVPSSNEPVMFSYSQSPDHWPQQADVRVDEMQPIRTPLAMPKAADPDSPNGCVNMFHTQAADAVSISKDGNWEDPQYFAMMPFGNESGALSYSRRPHRWPQQADVGVDEMQPIRTPLVVPKAADSDSPNGCVNMILSQAADADQDTWTTGQAVRGFHVNSRDGNWGEPQYFAMVPSVNESVMFSPSHWQQQAGGGVDEIQPSRTPLAMPKSADSISQNGFADMFISQIEDATGQTIRGCHVGPEDNDWEDPQSFAIVPPRNESVMCTYPHRPPRWLQQADDVVDEMELGRTPLVMPKAADPDSQSSCANMVASQTEEYSVMMPSGNDCVMFSHSRPWPPQFSVRVEETQPPRLHKLAMPKAANSNSQDLCANVFASLAEDATCQAIRAIKKRSARSSSTPSLRSNACEAASYACGVRVRNTFLEWQEPALFSL